MTLNCLMSEVLNWLVRSPQEPVLHPFPVLEHVWVSVTAPSQASSRVCVFTHSHKLENFCQGEASEPAGFLRRGGRQGAEQAGRHDTYEVRSAARGGLLVRKLKGDF